MDYDNVERWYNIGITDNRIYGNIPIISNDNSNHKTIT